MRILIVEDDAALARGIVSALRLSGFAVDHAARGAEVLPWLRQESYALVVLDLVSATDDAYLGLWHLLLSVDLVATVQYAGAQQSDPLGHALVDGRAVRVTHDEDHIWFRVLDTVAALQARPWAADGVVTIAVADSLGHAAGTFRVTSEGGSATVKRAAVRRAEVTAIGRSFPERMCDTIAPRPRIATGMCPPTMSVVAGAAPLYGTCTQLKPALRWSHSPARCCVLPVPLVP